MTIYNSSDFGLGPDLRNPPPVRYGVLVRRHPGSVLGPALTWLQDSTGRLVTFDTLEEARREALLRDAEGRRPNVTHEGARIGAAREE